eukprot:CAMPEP_0197699712 /NCGR_PEP_ID=MMETSP1338-20131121/120990_1 /TAXON_ID=43686 ORGANISM="Pelagodinium beii, Strain RCC1491" /NCGR_SAMPLE_ID=MMETSP1338 /ASSEMBLY_ACC=CAM_ASM_000754 /LENGTH=61 /DNA_ID=CAMNT_0043283233 /DNA_START=315 /DNA_END=497 /DNA_ORIENTATION=-
MALLSLVIYIFGVLGLELVTRDTILREDPLCAQIVETNFGSLYRTVTTLTQFVTMDSVASV